MDRHELELFLKKHGLTAKKQFGQNFLVDQSVLDAIIGACDLGPADRVIEIGAGVGALTSELAQKAGHITALEIDDDLIPVLHNKFSDPTKVTILHTDVRNFTIPETPYKLIANIPYYLTSPIFRKFFLESSNPPTLAVLLIQREVAEKVCIENKLSPLALEVKIFGTPSIVRHVGPTSFLPPPKVDSSVLRVISHVKPLIDAADITDFFRLLHAGFHAPRKKIRGSLTAGLPYPKEVTQAIVEQSGIDTEKRPEDLTLEEWKNLLAAWRNASQN